MQEKRRAWTERIPHERLELSPRDIEILSSVYTYRFLTSSQLTKMFFPSKSFADRRLRKLYDHGFLDRIQRPVTEGKCELLYALWTEGARVLSRKIKISREELGWSKSKNRVGGEFLEHELEVTQFRLALRKRAEITTATHLRNGATKRSLSLKKGTSLMEKRYEIGGRASF